MENNISGQEINHVTNSNSEIHQDEDALLKEYKTSQVAHVVEALVEQCANLKIQVEQWKERSIYFETYLETLFSVTGATK